MIYYLNMASVGTMYAMTVVQFELPRLLGILQASSLLPFAAVCVGLSLGVGTAAGFIQRHGARSIAAMGTSIWGLAVVGAGYSLSVGSLASILACLLGGGVGVGWTYLAIVVAVGRDFQRHPLARSAIGPLGFSSGTAATVLLSEHLAFAAFDADQLGRLMGFAGMAFVLVGVAALALPKGQQSVQAPTPVHSEEKYDSLERGWKITLFFNAFPGMAIFAALLPFASDQIHAQPRVATALTLGTSGGVLWAWCWIRHLTDSDQAAGGSPRELCTRLWSGSGSMGVGRGRRGGRGLCSGPYCRKPEQRISSVGHSSHGFCSHYAWYYNLSKEEGG